MYFCWFNTTFACCPLPVWRFLEFIIVYGDLHRITSSNGEVPKKCCTHSVNYRNRSCCCLGHHVCHKVIEIAHENHWEPCWVPPVDCPLYPSFLVLVNAYKVIFSEYKTYRKCIDSEIHPEHISTTSMVWSSVDVEECGKGEENADLSFKPFGIFERICQKVLRLLTWSSSTSVSMLWYWSNLCPLWPSGKCQLNSRGNMKKK